MDSVELHQAFSWTCDSCGADQFTRGVTLSREEAETLCEEEGIELEDGCGVSVVMAPDTVTCAECGTEYEVDDEGGIRR